MGVKVGRSGIKIPFYTFVDDTMIFAKSNEESCHIIKHILNKYCQMSGQLVNFHKSASQCTKNVLGNFCLRFQEILQMENGFSVGKYLGCSNTNERVPKGTLVMLLVSPRNN